MAIVIGCFIKAIAFPWIWHALVARNPIQVVDARHATCSISRTDAKTRCLSTTLHGHSGSLNPRSLPYVVLGILPTDFPIPECRLRPSTIHALRHLLIHNDDRSEIDDHHSPSTQSKVTMDECYTNDLDSVCFLSSSHRLVNDGRLCVASRIGRSPKP